jgi:LCP family protein required for cell wall assembly
VDPIRGARSPHERRSGAASLFGEGGSLGSSARASAPPASTSRSATPRSSTPRTSTGTPSTRRTAASARDLGRGTPRESSRDSRPSSSRDLGRGTSTRPPTRTRPSSRPRPAATPPPPGGTLVRRTRLTLCILSALVLVLTGTAWTFYRDVTGGITTTNVITGGSSGGEQNILLVGVDSRTDAQGNPLPDDVLRTLRSGAESGVLNSDTIIVLHIPADGGGATAFSIPRDSYVDIPGYRKDKINAAYPATKALKADELVAGGMSQKEADTQSSATGRSTLIETVQNLTGLQIDHYAEINLLGFYNLTQAVGGVDVCLKNPVNDDFSGADFPAGPQTISGADALAFVRQRHGLPESDLSRIRRQQVFLAAVADKILSTGTLTNPSTLSALIDSAEKSLVIDQGWDLLGFARQASDIAAGNIDFMTIPTQGGENNARGDVVVVDPAQVAAFVTEKTTPVEETSAAPAPEAPKVDPATVTVDVGNGSGGTGLAGQVADQLTAGGFQRGVVENAASRATSVVRYSGDGQAAAQSVAAQLGGLGVEQSGDVQPGHVQVLIGTDYAGAAPATSEAAAAPTPAPVVNAGGVPCID